MGYISQTFTGEVYAPGSYSYNGTGDGTFTLSQPAYVSTTATSTIETNLSSSSIPVNSNVQWNNDGNTIPYRSGTYYLGYYLDNGVEHPLITFSQYYYLLGETATNQSYTIVHADYTQGNAVACYARGTHILTIRGEVPVEDLHVGDLAVTFTGTGTPLKPIRWLGHRRVDLRRHPDIENIHPIRFRAGSLGEGVPHRDLVVSPGHRMRIGEELVTALELVNGATIVQESPDEAEYWHIELHGHDVILAEGVQAETYVDTGNRSAFENAAVVVLNPALDGDVPEPCLPYAGVSSAVRARMIARAEEMGWERNVDPEPWLEVDGQRIEPTCHGMGYRFSLPSDSRSVRLRSRSTRPWDVDPHAGDRRQLGLKLHRLAVAGSAGLFEVSLDSTGLKEGFNRIERDAEGRLCRWTTGDTPLPLAELAPGQDVAVIEIAYDQALPMWVTPPQTVHGTWAIPVRSGSAGG